MANLQMATARQRDLGGFVVRRVLPAQGLKLVGPFIFFDHMGPTQFEPGHGIDVRPHPHIALASVTHIFAGSLLHRDSLGNVREILPGDVNWMTAGAGIAHSERTPPLARAAGEQIHGIQSWVARPDGQEDIEPDLHAKFTQSAALEVPPEHEERAVYVVSGELEVGETKVRESQLAVLDPGASARLRALRETRAMLLGGKRFCTPRHIWWNFVASSPERIERAKERWAKGQFAPVPGETEFIPLPPA